MYERYWGLDTRPFENHFSSLFFFHSETHDSALLKLRYAIENRLGVGVLCGGIGSGKSAVASELSHELDATCGPVANILFPQMPAAEFLAYLASKLGGGDTPADLRSGMDRTLERIESLLRSFAQKGRRPTIVIDDAHLIDNVRVWECLQLLLNFQHHANCDFSLVLVGGLSLMGRLARTPQLNDRVAVFSVLEPLSRTETIRYVTHRLAMAGAKREIFHRTALDALCERSGGIPRRINRLADLALVVGFADELTEISGNEIDAVAEELPFSAAA
ncbi:MAG TPA: AAA family ATPase [Planctomycetaceae bacterium]|nr:AAA family ATPase [Planctomycetaceae bacterium]